MNNEVMSSTERTLLQSLLEDVVQMMTRMLEMQSTKLRMRLPCVFVEFPRVGSRISAEDTNVSQVFEKFLRNLLYSNGHGIAPL